MEIVLGHYQQRITIQKARLLTPATSHTYLAGPERLWSNLKAGVALHRHMVE